MLFDDFDECVTDDGELVLQDGYGMEYYLDWSTFEHKDAVTGVACLVRIMAQKFLEMENSSKAERIVEKLAHFLEEETTVKPVRAFQILAGRPGSKKDAEMLSENGCEGFSTFMAYYILKELAK